MPGVRQRRLHALLDGRPEAGDRLDVLCYYLQLGVIVAAVSVLIVGTVPSIEARWGRALRAFDVVVGLLFLLEYLARLWTAPVGPRYRDGWRGRLRYARSPLALLDLVAVIALLVPHLPIDLRQARLARLFALLRIGKLGRFGRSVSMAMHMIRSRRDDLLVAFAGLAFVLLIGSTLMYFVEHEAQPDKFSSIPETLWWGVVTLTTVGYGDVYPVTVLGRILGGLFAVLGIASFALPTAILGAAFMEELQRSREQWASSRCPTCGQPRDGVHEPPAAVSPPASADVPG
jgi:voltage-gated potassium channel